MPVREGACQTRAMAHGAVDGALVDEARDGVEVAFPSDRDVAAVSEVFAALASPVRVAIIDHLDRQEACVHDLVRLMGLPQPQVSQHLRVLRAADLVVGTRRGREVAYALADEHVAHIVRDALVHAREGARA